MTDIKWIKIKTDMFDDEKIKLIQAMPEGDSLIVIWVRLLSIAGRINANGRIYLNDDFPYTDQMLSTLFNKPINIIQLAINVFQKFGMISVNKQGIEIINWEKHQNVEGMDKIREQSRLRMIRYRKHRKTNKIQDVTSRVTSPLRNVTRQNKNKIEIKNKSVTSSKSLDLAFPVEYLNQKTNRHYDPKNKTTQRLIIARYNEGRTKDDFKLVIDKMTSKWLKEAKMIPYLRPSTLFNATNFENYLNEPTEKSNNSNESKPLSWQPFEKIEEREPHAPPPKEFTTLVQKISEKT